LRSRTRIGKSSHGPRQHARRANHLSGRAASIHSLLDASRSRRAKLIAKQLDELALDASRQNFPEDEVIAAAMIWAAERAYAAGGYDAVRTAVLDSLEAILFFDANKKSAA
jgi:hypothetical protein